MVGRGSKKWPPVCTDGTHVPLQLIDSTVPYLVLRNRCHTDRRGDTGAVVLATKIRHENGNDHTEVRGNYCAVGSSLFLLSVCFCLCSLFYRDDVLCWLLLARPFLYAFHAHLRFPVDLVWFRLSCDHGWIRSGSVNVRKQQQQNNNCAGNKKQGK